MFFQFLSRLFLPTAFVKINVVNQTRVGFLGSIFRLRERNKISFLLAYILHKTWNWALLCYSGAKTAKKCTKKCDALAKLLFCLLNLFFFTFLLRLSQMFLVAVESQVSCKTRESDVIWHFDISVTWVHILMINGKANGLSQWLLSLHGIVFS